MKPSWSGMISFGLVNIPVGLYPATEESDVSFNFLHAEDHAPIKNQRVCTKCGKVVQYKEIERGYEYAKGQYVTIEPEDLKKAEVESSRNINIEEFVDPAEIDPVYFEKPYHVVPDKKSAKPYALLRRAMLESGKVGLAKIALRTREHLAALRATENGFMLYMMHFTDEIRKVEDVPTEEAAVGDRELKMAEMLIETMVETFDPSKYRDTYAESLKRVIDAKIAGQVVEAGAEKRDATEVVDLMAMLKASIEKSGKKTDRVAEDEPLAQERAA